LESLENKHRECLMHSSNKHSKISEQSEEAKKKLEGLILRKIELKKDCINNALNSTNLPLPKKQYKKCQKVFNKYLKDDMLKERDYKQNNISLNPNMLLTKRKNFRELRRCNKTKKFWHKQCMILASCCSERDR
uniref:Uncharacterized protein n=1 Tax=Rhabditophanes sp. KR3021 TaxID=114890 RepID=A0AC35U5M3_9BILA